MKDWKTTAAGVATILVGVLNAGLELYHHQPVNMTVLGAAFASGVGLIHASDSK